MRRGFFRNIGEKMHDDRLVHALAWTAVLIFAIVPRGAALFAQQAPAIARRSTTALPMCTAADLSLAIDEEGGYFAGMSHGGTLVVLRNIGTAPCRVEPFAPIIFEKNEKALPIRSSVTGARFMHPGPVVFTVIIATGAELTATLNWVSGEVFSDNLCFSPTRLSVSIQGSALHTPFKARVCGQRSEGVFFRKTRFMPDPVYTPAFISK